MVVKSQTLLIVVIILLLDVYIFQVVKSLTAGAINNVRFIAHGAYWVISSLTLLCVCLLSFIPFHKLPNGIKTYVLAIIIGLSLAKIIAALFFLVDDVRRGITWLIYKPPFNTNHTANTDAVSISRSTFLSWLGIGLGGSLFGTLLYGFSNKYAYTIKHVSLSFPNLPIAFKELKIIHISDIHAGSFTNKKAVHKGVQMILDTNPDIILFTGDLVNDRATEMDDYIEIFSKLKAPMGVYSTLGNHDYGDYTSWKTEEAKKNNLAQLKAVHQKMGWHLLLNEHVVLEKNNQHIALIGIENWGAKAFSKYGKLNVAYKGAETYPFKILMSHDPSHWDAEVRKYYTDIDLTLAGHTHGMQFGVELPGFKWSPVQYLYKQWAGLYEEEHNQKLYVNRGFGFIGYPGRVGIMPEITCIKLT